MKKIITIFMCAILTLNCIAASAGSSKYEYIKDDAEITVEFDSDSTLTDEQKQNIADHLVNGDDGVETCSLCWLTGHDYVEHCVTLITHKVRELTPRCKKSTYFVPVCSKCEKVGTEELVSETLIACCPED